ncbi:AEC family transporter [Micromonospora cathayae]|uniref:AEC family transporter n=1 Tax=Micromonospora cathayae TaxID=3028804 RepID=A0ABY7ZWD5_9ACTN|nr:AEC family transporter [Micromonospora sp. HUAS 3]WDZ87136.1 AEC family transporter [Micromonospora sp. HUAS 3]
MPGVLTGFAVIVAVVVVGWLVGRRGVLGPEASTVLARVSFFVATPALLFLTVARADVLGLVSSALVVTVLTVVVVAGGYLAVALLWWRRPAPEATIGALSSSYVNAANIGIPIAGYVLGDVSVVAPVMMLQLVVLTPLAFAVLETTAGARDPASGTADPPSGGPADGGPDRPPSGSQGGPPSGSPDRPAAGGRRSLVRVVAQPVANPVTVACALGVVCSLTGWLPPEPVLRPVELVAAMAVPAALLAYGLSLSGAPRPGAGDTGREVWLAVFLKAVAQPAVAYLVARYALGLPQPVVLAATVTAALPTAQNVFVYAVRYDRGVVLARDAVLLSTVAAVPVLLGIALLAAH